MRKIRRASVIDLGFTDPYFNLALEEYLCGNSGKEEAILFLWQNDHTIVIGQNQSVYSQCEVSEIKNRKMHIARRRSGGGAVYHDLGNLNFTLITPNYEGVCNDNFSIIIKALAELGIKAQLTGRNDILCQDRKISGNAYWCDEDRMCHHGTILVDTDLKTMYEVLRIDKGKWKDKGIASAVSRTINLKEISPTVSIERVKKSLVETFIKSFSDAEIRSFSRLNELDLDRNVLKKIIEKYSSEQWIYEKKIQENMHIKNRFSWGCVEGKIYLENNKIIDGLFFSDALDTAVISWMNKNICGVSFTAQGLNELWIKWKKMNITATDEQMMMEDIIEMLSKEVIN